MGRNRERWRRAGRMGDREKKEEGGGTEGREEKMEKWKGKGQRGSVGKKEVSLDFL